MSTKETKRRIKANRHRRSRPPEIKYLTEVSIPIEELLQPGSEASSKIARFAGRFLRQRLMAPSFAELVFGPRCTDPIRFTVTGHAVRVVYMGPELNDLIVAHDFLHGDIDLVFTEAIHRNRMPVLFETKDGFVPDNEFLDKLANRVYHRIRYYPWARVALRSSTEGVEAQFLLAWFNTAGSLNKEPRQCVGSYEYCDHDIVRMEVPFRVFEGPQWAAPDFYSHMTSDD